LLDGRTNSSVPYRANLTPHRTETVQDVVSVIVHGLGGVLMSTRGLIAPKGDKRFALAARRAFQGMNDVSKSLAADRKHAAKKTAKAG